MGVAQRQTATEVETRKVQPIDSALTPGKEAGSDSLPNARGGESDIERKTGAEAENVRDLPAAENGGDHTILTAAEFAVTGDGEIVDVRPGEAIAGGLALDAALASEAIQILGLCPCVIGSGLIERAGEGVGSESVDAFGHLLFILQTQRFISRLASSGTDRDLRPRREGAICGDGAIDAEPGLVESVYALKIPATVADIGDFKCNVAREQLLEGEFELLHIDGGAEPCFAFAQECPVCLRAFQRGSP